MLQDITQMVGYDPSMGDDSFIGLRWVEFSEIAAVFPKLPVFTIENGEIVDLTGFPVSPYT